MSQSPHEPAAASAQHTQRVALAIAWGVVVAIGGGFACGLLVSHFAELGSLALWPLGALAGYVARRIVVVPCKGVAWGMVIACIIAAPLAEVCWIHWNTTTANVPPGWLEAITQLPLFVKTYTRSAVIAALMAGFGAYSAWRQIAGRGIGGAQRSLHDERILHGLCPSCGYRLSAAAASPTCPECGATVPPELRRDAQN